MTKERLIYLLTRRQLDLDFLYSHYKENGGRLSPKLFSQLINNAHSIEDVYIKFMIKFGVNKICSNEGVVIKYY